MTANKLVRVVTDGAEALRLVGSSSWRRILQAWVRIPIGILITILAIFGVEKLIEMSGVSFPASVACMITLFVGLILSEALFGDKRTRAFTRLIEPSADFCLRWINIFFCPSFVLLPLSPAVGAVEVGKIIAVLLIGYVAVTAATICFVRALSLMLGSPKRALVERAEETGSQDDNIPLTVPTPQRSGTSTPYPSRPGSAFNDSVPHTPLSPPSPTLQGLQPSLQVREPSVLSIVAAQGGDSGTSTPRVLHQDPPPLTRAQRWAAAANYHLDLGTYGTLFIFIGLPVYYIAGYAMPVQLTLNIMAYFGAQALPVTWKRFLHPVMVTAFFTVMGIWVLALCQGQSLFHGLRDYQTRTKFKQLLEQSDGPMPGAADVFGSVLEASIVALALPMFQYRNELRQRFLVIIFPNVVLALASLFGYPPVCAAIGISPERSLSFASRSLTLALATPATANIGGDLNIVAVLCIVSGMLGVLLGPTILDYLKIPADDYITRGISLGANSSAIATAMLLATDPRAAAFSSLSMSLFGTVAVAITSVPPVVNIIASLAGL